MEQLQHFVDLQERENSLMERVAMQDSIFLMESLHLQMELSLFLTLTMTQ